jgi:hypothetical protein
MFKKFTYYLISYIRLLIPSFLFRLTLKKKLGRIYLYDADDINDRVNYYNKLGSKILLSEQSTLISEFRYRKHLKTYFFDAYSLVQYFPSNKRAFFLFGDITTVPEQPSFVKSRPIGGFNENAVLLKLNRIRHFNFVHDKIKYRDKKNILVGRNKVFSIHEDRIKFIKKYFSHPLCDVAPVNDDCPFTEFIKSRMSISEQLNYKFILCLEGNDVASNLKWVMSSNSVAVMNRPKFETWFMEGKLIPDYHYIELKDDFSDLEEKLEYYLKHPEKAEQIIDNAHTFVRQFMNPNKEALISLMVIDKYFNMTGQ